MLAFLSVSGRCPVAAADHPRRQAAGRRAIRDLRVVYVHGGGSPSIPSAHRNRAPTLGVKSQSAACLPMGTAPDADMPSSARKPPFMEHATILPFRLQARRGVWLRRSVRVRCGRHAAGNACPAAAAVLRIPCMNAVWSGKNRRERGGMHEPKAQQIENDPVVCYTCLARISRTRGSVSAEGSTHSRHTRDAFAAFHAVGLSRMMQRRSAFVPAPGHSVCC